MRFNVVDVQKEFVLAEIYVERAELVNKEMAFSLVRELQYPGRYLCRAMVETDKVEHYQKAIGHIRGASCGALEILLDSYMRNLSSS